MLEESAKYTLPLVGEPFIMDGQNLMF